MSRFLFVVPPLAGHVYPAGAVARSLAERGHQVAWAGSPARLLPLLGPDTTVFPTGMRPHRGRSDTGMAALRSLWEGFVVPYARFTFPATEKAVVAFQPDVVVADQHALAGPLAALRRDLPWATLCTSSIELARPWRRLPKVEGWITGQLARLCAEAGLDGEQPDLRFSPYLVIAFTTSALTGEPPPGEQVALVGPALADRPDLAQGCQLSLDPGRRHLLVTVGTLAEDIAGDFYGRVLGALAPLADQLQCVLVAPAGTITGPPEHILPVPRVPLLRLLPELDAVLCHGGMNTVCEALSFGVPLIVAPIRHDQPINAAQVAAAGAGIRVSFHRSGPAQLRQAVLDVLADPGYRAAAARVRESFAAAGGAAAAAARLERLAA
jgi:zeaxanthin glucosyltransferase